MNKLANFLFVVLLFAILSVGALAHTSVQYQNASLSLVGGVQQTLSGTFDIKNTGHVSASVTFENLTLTSGSRSLAISTINSLSGFAAGATQTVSFSVPLGTSFATTYTGQILAKPTVNTTTETKSLPLSVTVSASPGLSASSPSITAARGVSKSTTLTLTNTGNTDLNPVTLSLGTIASGSNILPSSAIVLSKTSTSVTSGTSDAITVTVTPSSTQAIGTYTGPITINFGSSQITATLTATVRDPVHSVKFQNDIKVGSSTQARNTTVPVSFTIENDGDFTETFNLSVRNIASNFNSVLSKSSMTLSPAATETATLTLSIPVGQDSGSQVLGQVVAGLSSGNQVSKDVTLELASKLSIRDVKVKVAGKTDSDVGDGQTIDKKAQPEDDIEVEVRLENLFSKSDDVDIQNVDTEIIIEDIDDGDDLDPSKDPSSADLKADDAETVTAKFKVPLKVDEQTYDITIKAEGEDDNGAIHIASRTIKLRVDKESDDVRITRNDLLPETIECEGDATLRVEIVNFGSNDQDDVAFAVTNTRLDLNEQADNIELSSDPDDDDNEAASTFTIPIARGTAAGTYPIDVILFIDNDERMDKETVNLRVEACTADVTPQTGTGTVSTGANLGTTSGTGGQVVTQPIDSTVVESVEEPFTETPMFLALLVLGNVVAMGALLVLVFKFMA